MVFTGAGGNEVIRVEERPDPEPSGHDVLVAVRYAALNPADVAQREGRYPAAEAAAAFDRLQEPGKLGKVLLDFGAAA